MMFLKQFAFTRVWGSPAVSVVVCGALKDPGGLRAPQQSLGMAGQSPVGLYSCRLWNLCFIFPVG